VAKAFAKLGLEPAGEQGGWFQPVPLPGPAAGGKGPGVTVAMVMEKSPAEKAGLLPRDRIVALGGRPTPDRATLAGEMRRHRIGEVVAVGILRADKSLTLSVTLGKG